MRLGRPLVSRLALIPLGVLVGLVLAEVAARVWLEHLASRRQRASYTTFEAFRNDPNSAYARHHYLPLVLRPSYGDANNRHNELGLRGDPVAARKPEGRFRVIAVGGSTTYTVKVLDHRQSYPSLLQRELRARGFDEVEVLNAGVPGYTTWDSLINLEFRLLELSPDLVLIYHGINDVTAREVPGEAFLGDNAGIRQPLPELETRGLERSALYRILATRVGIRRRPVDAWMDYLITPDTFRFVRSLEGGEHDAVLRANGPQYFQRNLRSILAVCREHGVRPVLLTFKFAPVYNMEHPRVRARQRAIDEHNMIVRQLAAERAVPLLDLAGTMEDQRSLWYDNHHVTAEGSRRKAELIADYLVSSGLLPTGPESP